MKKMNLDVVLLIIFTTGVIATIILVIWTLYLQANASIVSIISSEV